MPIYEYIAVDKGCPVCSKGFELRRPVDREARTTCPVCRRPVKKVISEVNSPRLHKPLAVSEAKQAGFTVYERRDKGVYERL